MQGHNTDNNVHRLLDLFRQHGGYWHDSLQAKKGKSLSVNVH